MSPLVSVIVPVYNVELQLSKCVASLLAQTYERIEIILVDDGSPDSCPRICDDFARNNGNVRAVHQKNMGLSGARNTGMDHSKGEYLTFVDSDDWVHPRYVDRLVEVLRETGCDIAACDIAVSRDGSLAECEQAEIEVHSGIDAFRLMMYQTGLTNSASAKLFPSGMKPFLRFPEGRCFEDLWTICRPVFEARTVGYVRESLYCYYQRAGSILHSKLSQSQIGDLVGAIDFIERFATAVPETGDAVRSRKFSCYARALYSAHGLEEASELADSCWAWIVENRKNILFDRECRMKNRLAALAAYAGRRGFLATYGRAS